MQIGFGATVLVRGIATGHIDGIGVYARSLLEELYKLGLEETIVNFGRCKDFAALNPFPVRSTTCLSLPYPTAAAFSLLTSLPFPGARRLKGKIDLFHAPDHHIPRLGKIPVVATVMDVIPLAHPEWVSQRLRFFKNMAFRQMARSAQQIITISEYSKADIVHYFGIPPERIHVTYLGVEDSFSRPIAPEKKAMVLARYGLRSGCFFIFVGTLQPRKNIGRIIGAHRQLPEAMQKAFPLVIVGRNGWGTDVLLPELKVLEVSGRGRWLNDVGDDCLHALLQSARALVYPSLYEGLGLPVLEGFAAGLPVISSLTTSIPEVAGDAALLVDPTRTDELADAMRQLAEDDTLAVDLIQRGQRRFKSFTWAACAQQTLGVYQSITG